MRVVSTKSEFNSLSIAEKFSFVEDHVKDAIDILSDTELYHLLKAIILDPAENSNIRKILLEVFVDCVVSTRLKNRHALSLLVDDWLDDSDILLEASRLRQLFLFHNLDETSVETVFHSAILHDEVEISSEAYFSLGLICMQKAFLSNSHEEVKTNLQQSYQMFEESAIAENRVDSKMYQIAVSIISDVLEGLWGGVRAKLEDFATRVIQHQLLALDKSINYPHVGFYRALNSLVKISEMKPHAWLEFRENLKELHFQYSEIKNQELQMRLSYSRLAASFAKSLEDNYLGPYFALNFESNLSRIDVRLNELDPTTDEYDFLGHIKKLATDPEKKQTREGLERTLKNAFPYRSEVQIQNVVQEIIRLDDPLELLNTYLKLSKPSIKDFTDRLIHACTLLQGNRKYRGAVLEDDRNTFIADLLESAGYTNKDQTKWSVSSEGKAAGEIDIFIREKDGTPFVIIEALILSYLKSSTIIEHIDKVFIYDTTGLEQNFVIVYSIANDFAELWRKYVDFIKKHAYQYQFVSFEDVFDYKFSDMRIGKAKHIRNNREIYLYHIFLNVK